MIKLHFKSLGMPEEGPKIVNILIEKTIENLKERVVEIFKKNVSNIQNVSIFSSFFKKIMENNKITIKNYLQSEEGKSIFKNIDLTKKVIKFPLSTPLSVSFAVKTFRPQVFPMSNSGKDSLPLEDLLS